MTSTTNTIAGVNVEEFTDYLGEGIHTAFRKAGDSFEANEIWRLLNDMDHDEWRAILRFVATPMLDFVVAEQAKASEQRKAVPS